LLAESPITPEIRSELTAATQQLGEIMRQDVEQISISADIIEVPLKHRIPGSATYRSTGAIVPFLIEGIGGGNTFQEFIALFLIIAPDHQLLENFGFINNPHKHVGLLAFTQLDNRGPLIPSWQEAIVTPGLVMVPVTITNCYQHYGMMTVHVDADWVGPRISLTFDADATLGAKACLRP
jgi:hypothetical protein